MLNQDRRLLDERWMLGVRAEQFRGDLAVIAQLDEVGQDGYFASRRSVSRLAAIAALIRARRSLTLPGRPKRSLPFSTAGAVGVCGFIAETLLQPVRVPVAFRTTAVS